MSKLEITGESGIHGGMNTGERYELPMQATLSQLLLARFSVMAASMRTLFLLSLVVASFCVAAEATSVKPTTAVVNLNVKVALQLNLKKCYDDVKVYVGAQVKGAVCAAGSLTVLKPVAVKLAVADVLYVDLEIGVSAVVKTRVVVDLRKVKKIGNVHHIVLDVVEDKKSKKLVVLCLGVVLKTLDLGLNLGVGLHL